jgi:hexosaminidase
MSAELGEEGYRFIATPDRVTITSATRAGVFYGIQTLGQLLPPELASPQTVSGITWDIPCLTVIDKPRFPWRSLLLDDARHFHGRETVEALLDEMARLKMNVFHWHLTDDQGWRIEIRKYPKLTEVGGWRYGQPLDPKETPPRTSGPRYGGYYTQAEIRAVVAYAAARHITVVPEIEMPGHATAAIAAYPWLGTEKTAIEVATAVGKLPAAFEPADPRVYAALSDILDEVAELFPSKVIHIGGDEVRFDQWRASESVRKLMHDRGMKSIAEVQGYFTNTICEIIERKGRHMMGWNDILGDDLHGLQSDGDRGFTTRLPKDTIIHFWKGSPELARKAIQRGHRVVNSWHEFTYLDYSYRSISLEKAYNFDPVFAGLTAGEAAHILGTCAPIWTEKVPDRATLERQVYPRLAAYAEVGWTSREGKNYASFASRMINQLKRWDQSGIAYARDQVPFETAQGNSPKPVR